MWFIGAVIAIGASLLWGFEMSKAEKQRVQILEGILALVAYADEQIASFRTPLSRIFEDFSSDVLEECGFLPLLRSKGAKAAIECLVENGRLRGDAAAVSISFAEGLGGGYSESQKALCTNTKVRLESCLAEIRSTLPGKIRMYRLLPLLLAVSLVILLI